MDTIAKRATPNAADLIGIETLRDVAGISRTTLRRRMKADGITAYACGDGDLRRRYLRREDAEFLLRTRPVPGDSPPENGESITKVSGVD